MGSRQNFLLDLHSVLNIDCSVKAEKWHPLCVDWFPINLAFSAVSPAGPPPAFFQQKYRNDIQQRNQNRKGHCFIQSLSRGNPGAVEATGRVIEIKVRQEWTDSGDSQSEMYFTIPVGPEMVQNSILSTGSVKPLSHINCGQHSENQIRDCPHLLVHTCSTQQETVYVWRVQILCMVKVGGNTWVEGYRLRLFLHWYQYYKYMDTSPI